MAQDLGKITGMQVREKTLQILDELKIHRRETYEDVLLRLIESYHAHHKVKDPPADVATAAEAPKQEA